jgi:hypothetical protein
VDQKGTGIEMTERRKILGRRQRERRNKNSSPTIATLRKADFLYLQPFPQHQFNVDFGQSNAS